jgi:hypothetical protein
VIPGFHLVPAGPEHADFGAGGTSVTEVLFQDPAALTSTIKLTGNVGSSRAGGSGPRPGAEEVSLPVGFTTFPGEIFRAPRSWVEKGYPTLTYFHEADKGGHFAAWEEPELFASEIRAALRPLR